MEQEDCVLMRMHEASEHYIELLRTCHDKVSRIMEEREVVKNLPVKKNADKNTEAQPQIPGQIDIFSFLAS